MQQLSQALPPLPKIAEEEKHPSNISLMPLPGLTKEDGKSIIPLKLPERGTALTIEKGVSMMSWLWRLGSFLERLGPTWIEGRTFLIEDDYIYRPKRPLDAQEINAVMELGMVPSYKSIVKHLTHLMAHRPLQGVSDSNRMGIVLDDTANDIKRLGCSEAALIWAIEVLRKGNNAFGGKSFPTGMDIITEVSLQQRKVNIITQCARGESGPMPSGYFRESNVDWLIDTIDAEP